MPGPRRITYADAGLIAPRPIYIPTQQSISKHRSALSKVLSGTFRMRVAIEGDSTNMARGAGTGGTGAAYGARQLTPAAFAAKILNGQGIPARSDAFGGNAAAGNFSIADYQLYDTTCSFGAGWSFQTGSFLGNSFALNSTTTNPFTYTPIKAADRFDLQYVTGSGFATFTVSDASGTLATVNASAVAGVAKITVTRAVADLTPITIQRTGTGGSLYVCMVDPWNSTLPEVCMLNFAWSGGQAAPNANTGSAFNAPGQAANLSCDTTYIEFGVNEKNTGVSLSTYINTMQTLITQRQAASRTVMLGITQPATLGNAYDLTPDWQAAIMALGAANNVPVIDHHSVFVSREIETAIYQDDIHLKKEGYAKKGFSLAAALLT